ncbi:MAG TPA: hypothetical protein VF406_04120 [Thermodesulfobacteriota bacterium]
MPLTSARIETAGPLEAMEVFLERGWTDGLPVVPPTPDRIEAALAAAGVEPGAVLGTIPERRRTVTAEKVAVNAVMAGCRPEYLPVVLAAVRAMLDPAFGLHGPAASTAGVAPLVIVNGPYGRAIGVNAGRNVFGPGHRANATIGRAVRLVLHNVCGGVFDRGTLGHPGRYTYCIGEIEDGRFDPLHVERGFGRDESVVTVMAAEAPNQVSNHVSTTPEGILATIADRMRALGSANVGGRQEMLVVLCPEHAATVAAAGWTKRQVREHLWRTAVRTRGELKAGGVLPPDAPGDDAEVVHATPAPEDLLVVVAGGEAGRFSAVLPGWARKSDCRAVSVRIAVPER